MANVDVLTLRELRDRLASMTFRLQQESMSMARLVADRDRMQREGQRADVINFYVNPRLQDIAEKVAQIATDLGALDGNHPSGTWLHENEIKVGMPFGHDAWSIDVNNGAGASDIGPTRGFSVFGAPVLFEEGDEIELYDCEDSENNGVYTITDITGTRMTVNQSRGGTYIGDGNGVDNTNDTQAKIRLIERTVT